ncbi:hypothetical protein CEY16_01205 [Halalkalibacillus sediminis]|uniref:Uncharacterized protein n=1 Tax=Halalkalibacillus sediminis TaxID=2018042 RepID=A0A2I0QVN1_9BACI|nr:hypothetical protein [Halalkalibacillus sediminis]PKR78403.1 hypothetical protein CEY16_01205 [Halalkalibacillus sediminis]
MKPFILLFGSVLLLTGCTDRSTPVIDSYQGNFEIVGEEKSQMVQNVSEQLFETSDRSNDNASNIEEFLEHDEDRTTISVNSGRYKLVPNGSGNVYVSDENNDIIFSGVLGSRYGVPTMTLDIQDTDNILFDGLASLSIQPVETEMKTELGAGIWHVGKDIQAGTYEISSPEGLGYVHIYDLNEEPEVYELLTNEMSSNTITINLEKGEVVKVQKLPVILLNPVES